MKNRPINRNVMQETRYYYSGLLGLALIAILHLISEESLSLVQTISLYLFILAIPILAHNICIDSVTFREDYKHMPFSKYFMGIFIAGYILPIFGLIFFIWHINFKLSAVFIILSIAAYKNFFYYFRLLRELNRKQENSE